VLYTLPVSLFGMSVAAAELPAMSSVTADAQGADLLRVRLDSGLRRIAYFVIPSAVAFLALGDVVAAALLQTGRFRHEDAIYVWGILAGSAVGLLASTLGRLYSSTYYALRDTGTPMRYAIIRVVLTTVLGYLFAIPLPRLLGVAPAWGAAGLTASAGIAGWVEMLLLRATLNARIGRTGLPVAYLAKLWGSAGVAAAVAWAAKLATPALHPIVTAMLVLGPYGIVFVSATAALRIPEASAALARVVSLGRRRH
jgi:putative peptidoglycan lipid II flippase